MSNTTSNKTWMTRMTVEAVLIVVSILLAFAIDAWWDERKERAEEQEILQGLQQEYTRNRDMIAASLAALELSLQGQEELLLASEAGAWDSNSWSIDDAFAALITPRTTDLAGGVRAAIISAGRVDVLSSKSLRAMLIGWENVLGEMYDDEIMGRNYVFDTIVPYLTRKGVPMLSSFEDSARLEESVPRSLADDPDLLSELLLDPEFRSILDIRYGFKAHGVEEFEAAIEAADEILEEIEKSLE